MSYGVWKKRGKGWRSIEIDGAGNDAFYQWQDYSRRYSENSAKALKKKARNLGVPCSLSLLTEYPVDDINFIRWAIAQLKRGWLMAQCDTGCEHSLWISYADDESLAKAKEALGAMAQKTNSFRFKEDSNWDQ